MEIVEEVEASDIELRRFLAKEASELLLSREFSQSIAGHVPGEPKKRVIERLERIRGMGR